MITTEDTEKNWSHDSARRLNPETVFQRFDNDTKVEGTFVSCGAVAVSPDGRTLFGTGSREKEGKIRNPNNQFDSEVYALSVQGQRLVRTWALSFSGYGDSCRDVVSSPDGKSVILLRDRCRKGINHAILMRLAGENGELIQQTWLEGEPVSFAMSADGSRLAVAMLGKTLHLLDQNLRLVQSGMLEVEPHGLFFPRSGHLLVAAGDQLLRVNTSTMAVDESKPIRSYRLVADEKEELLAVSEWFWGREVGIRRKTAAAAEP